MPTGRSSPRGTLSPAARWLLTGLVIAGVFGMHVLSEHDVGGGHGMIMSPPTATVGHSGAMAMPLEAVMAVDGPSVSAAPGPDGGMSGGMATCILFLVIGASLILLALVVMRRADWKLRAAQRWWLGSELSHGGPPGVRPPRISLCVLRV